MTSTDDPIEWGKELIRTRDHDPIYEMLAKGLANGVLDRDQLDRWLVAYWCFYHAGVASYMSEFRGSDFWGRMHRAASNVTPPGVEGYARWPRAAERRHFRGGKACLAIQELSVDYRKPEDFARYLYGRDICLLEDVVKRVKPIPQFGPWMAFKIADMAENLRLNGILFPIDINSFYKDPKKAAEMIAGRLGLENSQEVVYLMIDEFGKIDNPIRSTRKCNVQEIETVLCKWKSCVNGNYYIGKDIQEVGEGLVGWGETAAKLKELLPPKVA